MNLTSMNHHKGQVSLIVLSLNIALLTGFILSKLSNHKYLPPLFLQLCLWCITGLALLLTFLNCCFYYQNKKQDYQKSIIKRKAVKDFHRYYKMLNPPDIDT